MRIFPVHSVLSTSFYSPDRFNNCAWGCQVEDLSISNQSKTPRTCLWGLHTVRSHGNSVAFSTKSLQRDPFYRVARLITPSTACCLYSNPVQTSSPILLFDVDVPRRKLPWTSFKLFARLEDVHRLEQRGGSSHTIQDALCRSVNSPGPAQNRKIIAIPANLIDANNQSRPILPCSSAPPARERT